MVKKYEVECVEVSAKTGEGVREMFEALPAKIEAVKMKAASKEAARGNYTINVVSTARTDKKGLVKENAVMCANHALFWLNVSLKIWFSDCI